MFNLLIYKKIYHNNLELKEIYTVRSKHVHNVYRFMYHYICKLRINLISQYFPLFCQPWIQEIEYSFYDDLNSCLQTYLLLFFMSFTAIYHLYIVILLI